MWTPSSASMSAPPRMTRWAGCSSIRGTSPVRWICSTSAVHGKSGHGAAPHTAHDAIACAGYLITALQTVVSRRIDPMDSAVLTVGTMSGGDAVNITAGEARMVAVLRSFSDTARDTAIEEIDRICKGIGFAFGCDIEVRLEEGYALQYNDGAMIDLVEQAVTEELGADKVTHLDRPFSGSEDFSFFGKLTNTPSAFMMTDVGCGQGDGFPAQWQDRVQRGRTQVRHGGHERHRAEVPGGVSAHIIR